MNSLQLRVLETESVKDTSTGVSYEYHSIKSATEYAHSLFKKHNLDGWKFEIVTSTKKHNIGTCWHTRKLIRLQARFFFASTKETINDTILHEVAHAIAGYEAGHGPEWKHWCNILGCIPNAMKDIMNSDGFRKDWLWTNNTKQEKILTQEKIDEIFSNKPVTTNVTDSKTIKTMPSKKAAKVYRHMVKNSLPESYFLETGVKEWKMKDGSTYHIAQLKLCKIHHEKIIAEMW